ncbi:MAG: hypothetical protein AAFX99_18180 [Myxococcota bacterium]
MTPWDTQLNAIESTHFATRLTSIVSDAESVAQFAAHEPEVKAIQAMMKDDPTRAQALAERARGLLARDFDEGYINPWDVAMTLYLTLLSRNDPPLARSVAHWVARRDDFWWARRLATRMQ